MIPIDTAHAIENHRRHPAVVSVLLASAFQKDTLEWVFSSWERLDRKSADDWHVLVPVSNIKSRPGGHIVDYKYDEALADVLAATYEVKEEDYPCLLFDNFNSASQQYYIVMQNWSDDDRAQFVLACRKVIDRFPAPTPGRQQEIDAWRTEVINSIWWDRINLGVRNLIVKMTPGAATLLSRLGT